MYLANDNNDNELNIKMQHEYYIYCKFYNDKTGAQRNGTCRLL